MTVYFNKPSEEELRSFETWLADRPQVVKDMIAKLPPNIYYRNTKTGQVMLIQAYAENGTVRALVVPEFNGPVTAGFGVFGLDPDAFEPATQEYLDERAATFDLVKEALQFTLEAQEPT